MQAPLAITCGDPAGIGPEVISRWIRECREEARGTVILGPATWLATLDDRVEKRAIGLEEYVPRPGLPDGEGALVAWAAMMAAAQGCLSGNYSGVVTGPVSKERLARVGYAHPGQTEFFAEQWGGEPTMAFCGGKLRVVLLTWHIPLRQVPSELTASNFHRAVRAADELARAEGIEKPRIGVCGLNPHAGEGGLLGTEERDVIDPILETLRKDYAGLSTAQPSDTLFGRQLRGEFDVAIAIYHDQGLAPLKVLDFDESVNVTLGLRHVRTSPDHGTAFGIAGKGVARTSSFANAVRVARRLVEARSR